jgi:hypothetical protein
MIRKEADRYPDSRSSLRGERNERRERKASGRGTLGNLRVKPFSSLAPTTPKPHPFLSRAQLKERNTTWKVLVIENI